MAKKLIILYLKQKEVEFAHVIFLGNINRMCLLSVCLLCFRNFIEMDLSKYPFQ